MKTAYINGVILDGKEDMIPVMGMTIITNGEFIVKAACDEAHKLGLPVAAHVESSEGVRVALEIG